MMLNMKGPAAAMEMAGVRASVERAPASHPLNPLRLASPHRCPNVTESLRCPREDTTAALPC